MTGIIIIGTTSSDQQLIIGLPMSAPTNLPATCGYS